MCRQRTTGYGAHVDRGRAAQQQHLESGKRSEACTSTEWRLEMHWRDGAGGVPAAREAGGPAGMHALRVVLAVEHAPATRGRRGLRRVELQHVTCIACTRRLRTREMAVGGMMGADMGSGPGTAAGAICTVGPPPGVVTVIAEPSAVRVRCSCHTR